MIYISIILSVIGPFLNIIIADTDVRIIIYLLPIFFLIQLGFICKQFSYRDNTLLIICLLFILMTSMVLTPVNIDLNPTYIRIQLTIQLVLTLAIMFIHLLWHRAQFYLSSIEQRFLDKIEEVIHVFTKVLDQQEDKDLMLMKVAQEIIPNLELEDCVIYLLDSERNVLIQKVAFGPKNDESDFSIIDPIQIPLGKGIVGHVAQSGLPEIIADSSKDKRYIQDDQMRFSELCVPIIYKDQVIGVIDSEHTSKNFFNEVHLQLIQIIAAFCAAKIAEIERKKLYSQSKKVSHESNKLRELNKMKSQFMSNLSHDLKTPLTMIIGPAAQLSKTIHEPQAKKLIELIYANGKQLNNIINELLNLNEKAFLDSNAAINDVNELNYSNQEKTDLLWQSKINSSSKPRILIIEDHQDMSNFILSVLEKDFDCFSAHDGRQGLNSIQKLLPDLIVLDLKMPTLTGEEICAIIQEDRLINHIPVVIISASSSSIDKAKLYKLGAENYLTKPFAIDELKMIINTTLNKRLQLREKFNVSFLNTTERFFESKDPLLISIQEIIEMNIGDNTFGVASLCKSLKIGRNQIQHKIKTLTGMTPVEFIRYARLKRSKQLLKAGNQSVSEVAYSVGFNNLSYFTRSFRKTFSCLPSDFKTKEN